jgi:hypothetical protein
MQNSSEHIAVKNEVQRMAFLSTPGPPLLRMDYASIDVSQAWWDIKSHYFGII